MRRPDVLRRRGGPLLIRLATGGILTAVFAAAFAVVGVVLVRTAILNGVQAPHLTVSLPTHHAADIARGGTYTGVAGARIERDGDCVYLGMPGRRWLVVWPTGTTLDTSQEPSVVRDGDGRPIVAVGDLFSMNGASYGVSDLSEVSELLDTAIPDACLTGEVLLAEPGVGALKAGPATWRIDPARPPDPSSDTVSVLLREVACASGLSPEGRVQPPQVDYEEHTIVITLTVLEIGGRCPDNPEYPLMVQLDASIGQRSLVDGSQNAVRWDPDKGIVEPTPDLGLDDCAHLELSSSAIGHVETSLDTVIGILDVRIFNDRGLLEEKLRIAYKDDACINHPVLGPIISRALSEE